MKSPIHTHYDNLRIQRNATPGLIKAAYRALSYEYHPDRNPDRDTTRIMQMLNDAYAVLSDPVARAEYDAKVAAKEAAAVNTSQAAREAGRPPPATDAAGRPATRRDDGAAKSARRANARPTRTVYALVGAIVFLFFALLAAMALA
jgi:curved DNA-binding protein CbpA